MIHTIILLILALVPGFIIGLYIYLMDTRPKESSSIIYLSIAYGALSFLLSLGIGYLLHINTDLRQGDVIQQMIRAVFFVGLVEEGCKFLFLRGLLFNHREFDQPFDGIVYAVMVGMGFATAENLLYVFNGDGGTAIVRMFTAVPAHAVFAVIMGFFIGEAKVFKTSSGLYSGMALLFAAFVHGYYDYFLFLPSIKGLWMQAIGALVIVVVITHFAIKYRKDEIIRPD
jgi:RsiW-degrading membrane proteinase PrsW (M82 family)